uniref:Uncharacterized protein n=1 Tax=Meloidogyne enterolobii TaxID=390850 RepID=A0A6V7WEV0_MELEN|nr:unnamed protein product [Meloidogyne enterolobii]
MATFFTSTLLIISIIATSEGMNTNRSASTSDSLQTQKDCKVIYGMFVPVAGSRMHGDAKNAMKKNNPSLTNKLIVSGGNSKYSVTLQVENQPKCVAQNNGTPVECQIQGDKLSGKLIYDIENGPSVYVPFKDTPIFVGNKSEIVLDGYDMKDHKLTLSMNKVKLMIEPTNKQIVKACGAKN